MTNFRTPLPNGFQNVTKDSAPRLMLLLNLDNLVDLPGSSVLRAGTEEEVYARLRADGFEGVQITHGDPLPKSPALPFCGLSRINVPSDAHIVAARHADRGDRCITVHLGWGIEDDREVDALVEAVLEAQQRRRIAIFIETHRATVTQDIWRTVQLIKRHPDLRFNGDFSHYYCGQELVYGDWNQKLHFLTPLFDRVGFMHGRIASPGCIQVPISEDVHARPVQAHGVVNYLDHFRELWTRAMLGFLRHAAPGDVLPFALELLAGTHYYARLFPDAEGVMREESDRYAQALLLAQIARESFAAASERQEEKKNAHPA
jgi:hypothetical protein